MAENGSTSTSSASNHLPRTQSSYFLAPYHPWPYRICTIQVRPKKAKTTSVLPSRYTAAVARYLSLNSLREKRKKKKKGVKERS
ncbi:uncharacterized protein Bfra_008597 [Botrytis fragariae]|uniref:Uncharacterized protein n=1 Tax=Botrytis fragariae TaxID=1964551 RepID=A0A8H6EIP2_9HELO|nr:uncharacterized protein Bfra_008597 [Botrytis fragariae]KAF5873315.1 hypothetical protein Bfra_008597 [Botrytis fragariae]